MKSPAADEPTPDYVHAQARFGNLVGRVYRQWRKQVDLSFKEWGLTDATRAPLLELLTQGEDMLQKDLAQALFLDTSSLVRVLDQLRERGLVTWACDPRDRRTKRIALTPEGRQIAATILQKSLEIERLILAELTAPEIAVTRASLGKISRSFDNL